jgi:hypothetical protein
MSEAKIAHSITERDVRIHPYLWKTSEHFLEKGQAEAKGSFYEFLASITFSAFTLEAYMNWLGTKLFPHWQYLERLSPNEKLALIADQLHLVVNKGIKPWQTMRELFAFRNSIVHGKPESLASPGASSKKGDFLIRADWETFITLDNASRVREDVEKMIETLHLAAKLEGESSYPFAQGLQTRDTTFYPNV